MAKGTELKIKRKITSREKNEFLWGWAFILPTMIGLIVLNIYPIIKTIYESFFKTGDFGKGNIFIGLANYQRVLTDPEVWQSLLNTFKYAIVEVPFSIIIALVLAVLLNRKMKGRAAYRTIFFLPMVAAPAAIAMVWRWLFNSEFGLLNNVFGTNINWISNPNIAVYSIGVIGVCASLLGAFMSPVIQGWISGYGWHTARIIISVIALVASVVLTAALLRESPEKMGVLPWGYGAAEVASAKSEAKSVIDVAADEGATAAQARKNPALWLLIIMAGFFVIAAGMMQQFSSYASTGALGAAVGAMGVTVCMIGQLFGKFGLGWLCDHTGARVSGVVASIFGAAGIAIVLFSVDNAMMFYVGVFLFGIGFAALNIVPPMACRQAFGQKDYANIFSMVATGLNVFSGFSALIYAQIFDITGSFAGCFYLIIGFYVVTLICSLVIVPMGRRSWAKK